jgi:hypothetical protein
MSLQVGGPVEPERLYIHRPEDLQLLNLLQKGEYCQLLTARQMGKSSLIGRVSLRLSETGVRVAYIDVKGSLGNLDAEDWYPDFLDAVARRLGLNVDAGRFWLAERGSRNERVFEFFSKHVIDTDRDTIVILDEIDGLIKMSFRDDVFAALRALHNMRGSESRYRRLTFCLVGCAAVDELIHDPQTTPYNVGQLVELSDFDLERDRDELSQLITLLEDAGLPAQEVLQRVFSWTGGQPFLTMYWCNWLISPSSQKHLQKLRLWDRLLKRKWIAQVDLLGSRVLARLEAQCEQHVVSIQKFLEERGGEFQRILDIHAAALSNRTIPRMYVGSTELNRLIVSGLHQRAEKRHTRIRNGLYRKWFHKKWVRERRPKLSLFQKTVIQYAVVAFIVALVSSIAFGLYKYDRDAKEKEREAKVARIEKGARELTACENVLCVGYKHDELRKDDTERADRERSYFLEKYAMKLINSAEALDRRGCVEQAALLHALAYLKDNKLDVRRTLTELGVGQSTARWFRPPSSPSSWKKTDCVRPSTTCRDLLAVNGSVITSCREKEQSFLGMLRNAQARLEPFPEVREVAFSSGTHLAITNGGAAYWTSKSTIPEPIDLVPGCSEYYLTAQSTRETALAAIWCGQPGMANAGSLAIAEWPLGAIQKRSVVMRPTGLSRGDEFAIIAGWAWVDANTLAIGSRKAFYVAMRQPGGTFHLRPVRAGPYRVLAAHAGYVLTYSEKNDGLVLLDPGGKEEFSWPFGCTIPASTGVAKDKEFLVLCSHSKFGPFSEVWEVSTRGFQRDLQKLRPRMKAVTGIAYSAQGAPVVLSDAQMVTFRVKSIDKLSPLELWLEVQDWAGLTVDATEEHVSYLDGAPKTIQVMGPSLLPNEPLQSTSIPDPTM